MLVPLWAYSRFPLICPVTRPPQPPVEAGPLARRWKGPKSTIEHATHVLAVYRASLSSIWAHQMMRRSTAIRTCTWMALGHRNAHLTLLPSHPTPLAMPIMQNSAPKLKPALDPHYPLGCLPHWLVISIDATHLYGKYKAKLLIAMATNANNEVYPLTFAVVKSETSQGPSPVLPCHVASNVNTKWKIPKLKNLVWRAASANQVRKFEVTLELIRNVKPAAHKYLEAENKQRWTLAHDRGRRYGAMTTNLSKCFNGVLKGVRSLPIIAMVRFTFFKVDTLGNPLSNGGRQHTHKVDLQGMTYTYGKWEAYKIPCSHVIAICAKYKHDAQQFIDPCYSVTHRYHSYKPVFQPLKDKLAWPEPEETRVVMPNPRLIWNNGRPKLT
ncbi:hypothetical protein SO802_017831 [Lithocarpus litseifolius]|uniref:Zinc finger PMZ-type domain-containing protein n=1 Tax=Lithocarpus litseifolius TaxID=425828 RepID=A0AAW2CJI3_9ROSI